jgi:hypothetical protein
MANWQNYLIDPRTGVLAVLGGTALIGGGLRYWRYRQGTLAVGRLDDPGVTPEEIIEVARYGRMGLRPLFELLTDESRPRAVRDAAGRALSILWAGDEMVAEEEQGLVRRGFDASWRARRRYPRALNCEIPIEVRFGVPFLDPDGPGVKPSDLEWSSKVAGTQRGAFEVPGEFAPGPGVVRFAINPADFPGRGPHRLVLQAAVRSRARGASWQIEPPHVPFSFELDEMLAPEALLASPDEGRAADLARRFRLVVSPEEAVVPLGDRWSLLGSPAVAVEPPLPCDLAGRIVLEFEGAPGIHPAGTLILAADKATSAPRPLAIRPNLPDDLFERPGPVRARAHLQPDPHLGWADPDIRSAWPEPLITDWTEIRVVRR